MQGYKSFTIGGNGEGMSPCNGIKEIVADTPTYELLKEFKHEDVSLGRVEKVKDLTLIHYSQGLITEFKNSQVSTGGKLGAGTYFTTESGGVGGKHLAGLQNQGIEHICNFSGNLLTVAADDTLDDAACVISEAMGQTDYAGSFHSLVMRRLSVLQRIGGIEVDGVRIQDDKGRGEVVIFSPENKVVIKQTNTKKAHD